MPADVADPQKNVGAGEKQPSAAHACPALAMPCYEGLISSRMVERGANFCLLKCETSHKRLDGGFAVAVRGAARGGARELKHTALPRRYSRALAQTALGALLNDVRGSEDLTKTLAQVGQGLPVALESIFTLTLGAGQLSIALVPTLHHASGDSPEFTIWSAMPVTPGGATRVFCCPRSVTPSDFVVAYFSEFIEHKAPIWYSRIFSFGENEGMLLGVADGGPGRRIVFGRGINCKCVDAQDAMRRPSIMA